MMRGDNKLTVFACDNGDTILIEAHERAILTDINYRRQAAEDPDNTDVLDFAPDLRAACDGHLDLFVLTHPDADHLRGADELFHLGPPSDHDPYPDEGEPTILIDEIWCSPYAADPNYTTAESKPLLDEIARRKRLQGNQAGETPGNRLRVLSASNNKAGSFVTGIDWLLHAPTDSEANIPKAAPGESPNSSNASSLVIRWNINISGADNLILLGGDTTVEVLERLGGYTQPKYPDDLAWNILVAVHHCSRRSIGRVDNPGKDEEFEVSELAERALSEQRGDGYIVSSSKPVIRGGNTPPSYHAKNRYLKILARDGDVSDTERKRFVCTSTASDKESAEHVIFDLTAGGPVRKRKPKSAARAAAISSVAAGRGGGYG